MQLIAAVAVVAHLTLATVGGAELTNLQRSVVLLQSSASTWTKRAACTSCHHQSLSSMAVAVARERGLTVDERAARSQVERVLQDRSKAIPAYYTGKGAIGQFGLAYALFGFGCENVPPNELTDAICHHLLITQVSDGGWTSGSHRQPMEDLRESITAFAIRGLSLYGGERAKQAIERGKRWLLARAPYSNEGRAMRLLGMVWANVPELPIYAAVKTHFPQNSDGGWSQLPGMPSDAYATAVTMVALRLSGVPNSDPRIRLGAAFLRRTQKSDGSWHVRTRRKTAGLPYFETGYPHGEDQFISFAGASWATAALAMTRANELPQSLTRLSVPPGCERQYRFADDPKVNQLFVAVAHGTVQEVRDLLNAGADPNGKNRIGATPLHWAVNDDAKTEALLAAGAVVDCRDRDGRTPLHCAAQYGTRDVLKRLVAQSSLLDAIERGRNVALGLAAQSYDPEKMRLLIQEGAKLDPVGAEWSPLTAAVLTGYFDGAKMLLKRGAKTKDLVAESVLNLDLEMTRLLLYYGARHDLTGIEGRNALHYASMLYAGHGLFVRELLAKGANRRTKDRDGLDALELARKHRNFPALKALQ